MKFFTPSSSYKKSNKSSKGTDFTKTKTKSKGSSRVRRFFADCDVPRR